MENTMTNAKKELLQFIEYIVGDEPFVKCAYIYKHTFDDDDPSAVLKVGHTDEEFNAFAEQLNFFYDAGYGMQELFGNVWFEDGSWMERVAYDGREEWRYVKAPKIHEFCL
jgi:hypothetical protein